MDGYDKLIAVFAGTLLVFDSLYVSLPILLTKLGYKLPKWIVVQTTSPVLPGFHGKSATPQSA